MTQVDVVGTKLDMEASFCYLGDMLCSSGGCDSAIVARCCVAWVKFRKLLPVLTSRHLPPKECGKVSTWLCSMVAKHGDRNISDLERLHRNDRTMIHWICSTNDQDETPSAPDSTQLEETEMVWTCTTCYILHQICHRLTTSRLFLIYVCTYK